MNIGDLFEVLVALGVVLVGLLGGRKKKKPPARKPPARRPDPTYQAPAPSPTGDGLFADLHRQLEAARGRALEEQQSIVVSLEDDIPEEEASRETLEPAGGASHERFHAEYIRPLEEVDSVEPRASQPPGGVRAAIVWAEILGTPKGLQG